MSLTPITKLITTIVFIVSLFNLTIGIVQMDIKLILVSALMVLVFGFIYTAYHQEDEPIQLCGDCKDEQEKEL